MPVSKFQKIVVIVLAIFIIQPFVFEVPSASALVRAETSAVKKPAKKAIEKPKSAVVKKKVKKETVKKVEKKPAVKKTPKKEVKKKIKKVEKKAAPTSTLKKVEEKNVSKFLKESIEEENKSVINNPIIVPDSRFKPEEKLPVSGKRVEAPLSNPIDSQNNYQNYSGASDSDYIENTETPPSVRAPQNGGASVGTGTGRLAQLLMSSPWCTMSATNNTGGGASGSSSTTRLQFGSDGSYSQSGERDTASYGYGGTYLGSGVSSGGGRWSAEGEQLMLANEETSGQMIAVPVEISANSNGYPIIKALGTEYFQCE